MRIPLQNQRHCCPRRPPFHFAPRTRALAFGISWLLLLPALLWPQQPPQPASRPRIGVALEGGGAKGLAHVGVLKWFEEHHIPVDYIAGTSMGGLVGGMYATGMGPVELERLVREIDWDQAVGGATPYQDLSYRRKEDLRAYQNDLEFGLRHGFHLPGGLNSGEQATLILDRITLPYSDLTSFDELPIPFRCVATELISGKPEVFKDGPLGDALRSTMSLPAVFAPVRKNGKVFADGGLVDNLPVDVAKQMGADIVIGVHLATGPASPASTQSLIDVAGRSIDVMIDAGVLRSMGQADVLVTVDVAGYAILDFDKAPDIERKGYEAAQAKAALLSRLALSADDWQQYLARRESRRIQSVPKPQFVEVEGTSSHARHDIQRVLSPYAGKPIDTAELEQSLTQVAGDDRYARIGYRLTKRGGQPGLEVDVAPKDYAPPTLIPSVQIDGTDVKNVQFTASIRLTAVDVGGYRSEVRTDVSAGAVYKLATEYYHPLTPSSRWFIAPRLGATSSAFDFYSQGDLVAEYRVNRAEAGFDVGYGLSRFSEVRLGYFLGYLSFNPRVGVAELARLSGRVGATSLRFNLDHTDDPVIPRRGFGLEWDAAWIDSSPGARTAFPSSELDLRLFEPLSDRASVYLLASGGTTLGRNQGGFPQFSLGGPARLAAYGINEFLANQYDWLRVGYIRRVAKLPSILGTGVYFSSAYEAGKVFYGHPASALPNDAVVGLVMRSSLGPAFIGGSVGDTGHRKVFFQFGKLF